VTGLSIKYRCVDAGHLDRIRADRPAHNFLVLTAEDEHPDGSLHPRENVIHEAGLFQGKLGFERAIILREQGCAEFSNIHGLTQIPFPKNNISAIFEEVRRVLEREGMVKRSE
jgi:predicted nucleotide-binding protein